jgi:hypothetical protein
MFRKSDGKMGFSFNRFITAAVPNFANSADRDMELSAKQQDDLFNLQISLPEPRVLGESSFYISGVVGVYPLPQTITQLMNAELYSARKHQPISQGSRLAEEGIHPLRAPG